ncbi:arylesterase [Paraburkholderia sp. LEh10]|uniref:arylesterase n=1 Tax=Paraburkholderia sp. LEh10 TaxID=2821353 RepID=UPI001AE6079E|nr:arylesterase [Paraburkholderia sp. LEh10]MBP0594486.1 arylesterase [Paraburkholderia sp. LEh10]
MMTRRLKVRAVGLIAALKAACIPVVFAATLSASAQAANTATQATAAANAAGSDTQQPKPTIVVLGDSISAEYGLPRDTGWVALMRQRLSSERIDYNVANASISGDTTSGGRARMPALMQRLKPAIVIVELGANDALRGVPLSTTEDNLRTIIEQAQQGHAKVLLIGMYVPPNYGPDYTQKFHGLYGELSKQLRVPLVPFLLAGIEDKPDMFQADQIHPTQRAQPVLLDNVWPALKPLLHTSSR